MFRTSLVFMVLGQVSVLISSETSGAYCYLLPTLTLSNLLILTEVY